MRRETRPRIEFEHTRHEYHVDGVLVPSVTQVLEPEQQLDGIPPMVLERARIFGTHVDQACTLLVQGQLDWRTLHENLRPYVNGAAAFLRETGFVVTACQLRVGSGRLRVAGTLDLIGVWKRAEWILDWKATHALSHTVGPQTAAYDYLYREARGGRARRRGCVHLTSAGYKFHELADPGDWNIFLSCLNLHHWRPKRAA